MPFEKLEKLRLAFPKLREQEPLKNHGTFRVGGPADFFYELSNIEELPALVALAEENHLPYRFIGRGTNVLFTDKGFRGLIIKNISNRLEVEGDQISADSGVLLIQIIRKSVSHHLTGLEPLYGLPGTIGGAVWGNAGVPGAETGNFVKNITVYNVSDGIRELAGSDVIWSYRKTSLQDSKDLILKVVLKLKRGTPEASKELMQGVDAIRRGKQPTGYTAGSFFKNPSPEKSAGYVIEQVGLKGEKLGDAEISPKHANFFMNRGKATAAEILELAKLAQSKVKEKFGIDLEMEVKIVGDL